MKQINKVNLIIAHESIPERAGRRRPPRHLANPATHSPKRILLTLLAVLAGLGVCGVLVVVFALAMAYPNLPALDTLTDYRPKMPLRIFTADNVLIGEFGEEHRDSRAASRTSRPS